MESTVSGTSPTTITTTPLESKDFTSSEAEKTSAASIGHELFVLINLDIESLSIDSITKYEPEVYDPITPVEGSSKKEKKKDKKGNPYKDDVDTLVEGRTVEVHFTSQRNFKLKDKGFPFSLHTFQVAGAILTQYYLKSFLLYTESSKIKLIPNESMAELCVNIQPSTSKIRREFQSSYNSWCKLKSLTPTQQALSMFVTFVQNKVSLCIQHYYHSKGSKADTPKPLVKVIFVAYNGNKFDLAVLQIYFLRYNIKLPTKETTKNYKVNEEVCLIDGIDIHYKVFDALEYVRNKKKVASSNEILSKVKSLSLQSVYGALHNANEFSNAHTAPADTEAMIKVLLALNSKESEIEPLLPTLQEIITHATECSFEGWIADISFSIYAPFKYNSLVKQLSQETCNMLESMGYLTQAALVYSYSMKALNKNQKVPLFDNLTKAFEGNPSSKEDYLVIKDFCETLHKQFYQSKVPPRYTQLRHRTISYPNAANPSFPKAKSKIELPQPSYPNPTTTTAITTTKKYHLRNEQTKVLEELLSKLCI